MQVKRNLSGKILNLLNKFPCVTILGVRQSGKTFIARSLFSDWKYVDLENPNDYDLLTRDPVLFFRENPNKLIIDEAQLSPQLFATLRGVIDNDRDLKGRFILTGSSSPELISAISESLAGRTAIVELGTLKTNEFFQKPLSRFFEIFENKNTKIENLLDSLVPVCSHNEIRDFWFKGTYPEPALQPDPGFYRVWQQAYFDTYINRDIRGLFPKLDVVRYRRFIAMLASLSGTIINQKELASAISISEPTAKDYLEIAHQTFYWRKLTSFEHNITKQITKMPKGHVRDPGTIHFLLKIADLDSLYAHPIVGKSFESFTIEELIKGVEATTATGWSYHYYRTRSKAEIDLILHGSFGVIPFEIKHGTKVMKGSYKVLKDFIEEHHLPYGFLINNGDKIEKIAENIYQVPVNYI